MADQRHQQVLVVAGRLHQRQLDARTAGEAVGEVADGDPQLIDEARDGPVLPARVAVAVVGGQGLAPLRHQEALAAVGAGAHVVGEALARDRLAGGQRDVRVGAPELGGVLADDVPVDPRQRQRRRRVPGDLERRVEDVADLAEQ
ncbi:hypothetical protein [Nannocystis pusilla]|uniref:hypothetical protein n=1 Tax=Nannocystis pusilla TaxID=889268 RepID=UPI003B827542